MSFSQYTLAGHQFFGTGVELSPPGNFRFSAMTGRLQKRVLQDSSDYNQPSYERLGTGLKVEYFNEKIVLGSSFFYAWDKYQVMPIIDTSKMILPAYNLALSFNSLIYLIKNLNLNVEYGISIFTENKLSNPVKEKYILLPFYTRRESSNKYNAFKINLSYNSTFGSIGFGCERVDPGYKTLGAYYNTNDFINYTVNYGGSILKNKITLTLAAGLQEDNLKNSKEQKNINKVANINISFIPIKSLNINTYYSNFYNFTNIKTGFENINTTNPYGYLDTLSFTQISETFSISTSYSGGKENLINHNLTLSFTYQKASEKQYDNPIHAGNKFFNIMSGYNTRVKNTIDAGLIFNVCHNVSDTNKTITLGPSITVGKMFFNKKVKTTNMLSYNRTIFNGVLQSENLILRLTAGYVFQKQHNFNISLINALRNNRKTKNRNETTVNFSYNYNFNFKRKNYENEK